jgi:hypothetical protein
MNQYKVDVTYTRLDVNENTVTKVMSFITSANSLEEARSLVQETAMSYINRVNGTFISVN